MAPQHGGQHVVSALGFLSEHDRHGAYRNTSEAAQAIVVPGRLVGAFDPRGPRVLAYFASEHVDQAQLQVGEDSIIA